MTVKDRPVDEDVEIPGQLDLLDEIPGETRGTQSGECGGKDEDNEHAD